MLSTAAFRDLLATHDAVMMTGDWTNVDPAITAFLEQHHAVGVPLYVVFPNDGGEGEVLPTVLTQDPVSYTHLDVYKRQSRERPPQALTASP